MAYLLLGKNAHGFRKGRAHIAVELLYLGFEVAIHPDLYRSVHRHYYRLLVLQLYYNYARMSSGQFRREYLI